MGHCRACHENRLDAFARAAKRVVDYWTTVPVLTVEASEELNRHIMALQKHIEAYEKDKGIPTPDKRTRNTTKPQPSKDRS